MLVHYDDLVTDLDGAMRRLAEVLGVPVDEERWPALVHAATFDAMRDRAAVSAPAGDLGVLKDPTAFFRRGVSGDGPALLGVNELAHYFDRVAAMAPADMLAWLHRNGKG